MTQTTRDVQSGAGNSPAQSALAVSRGAPSRVEYRTEVCRDAVLAASLPRWHGYVASKGQTSASRSAAWLAVLSQGLRHRPYCIEAQEGQRTVGLLPLAYVKGLLFGRFLVGLPYLNVGGVMADSPDIARAIIDRAVALANQLDVRHLELRHEQPVEHPALAHTLTTKVHMRLALPASADVLWKGFNAKVRNQVRKAEKLGLTVHWGALELLSAFYDVFARNMRDLGTPVYGRSLFAAILRQFPGDAEFCVVRCEGRAVAAGLLLHGPGTSEVPSASSLRSHNSTNANMLLYWHMLQRAVARGQGVFDFGRSSPDSGTYDFKKQWGAGPHGAAWQFYVRRGDVRDMRLESGKYGRLVRLWQRLPVCVTRWIGPFIVRGIP
jgi:FemAB-related protein (PEP-CTERM system-associated)